MKYDIQKVITELQNYQSKNTDIKLISEDELLSLATLTFKIHYIDRHIHTLEKLGIKTEYPLKELTVGTSWRILSAANMLNVKRATIYKWIKDGLITRHDYPCWSTKKLTPFVSMIELMNNLTLIKQRKPKD